MNQSCGQPINVEPVISFQGRAVSVEVTCTDCHTQSLCSQPLIHNIPVCNLLLPAAVFITGNASMTKAFTALNIQCATPRHSHSIQTIYVMPQGEKMLKQKNEPIKAAVAGDTLLASGDARCDSPGHSATFSTYTVLENASHLILNQETVKVTEVQNSYWLGPEGLKRCLKDLDDHEVELIHLAAHRHPAVQKTIREDRPDVKHEYNLWQVQTEVKKTVVANDPLLLTWLLSIINHLWYCAASCSGNAALLKEMWISILHHITSEACWATGEKYCKCSHEPYNTEKRRNRPWFKRSSKSFSCCNTSCLTNVF